MELQHNTRTKVFFKFVNTVSPLVNIHTVSQFQAKYYIKEFKLEEIDQAMAKNLFSGIVGRSKKSFVTKSELNWLENELRMFVWTLLFYAHSKNVEIHNFTQSEWEFFSIVFPNKRRILFEYQAYNLLKNHNQYKKWGQDQDELFERLVKKDNYRLRWSDLGKSLFIESDRNFFRTPKQCRERWLNHLDPSKMKKCWSEEEDFLLIQYVQYFGKKWANISKKLENRRNQHSIKNRFKSLVTKQAKFFANQASQKQIVSSLYRKILQNRSKGHLQQEESMKADEIGEMNSKQHQHFIFQEQERPQVSIFNESEQSETYIKHKPFINQILGNILFNPIENQLSHRKNRNQLTSEKAAFQFSKMALPQLTLNENTKKSFWEQNQIQKRVRADLFLQEDPFQMLKCYFYRNSSSSQ